MKTHRLHSLLLLSAALALLPAVRADDASSDIAFSDPSKPGTLKIHVWHGEVSVHGADVKEISVKSEVTPTDPTPRKDGMRVLSASAGFTLTEKGNVVLLEYGSDGWTGGSSDFDITVPRDTRIVVGNSARGDFECDGVSGDIDVRTMSGEVNLTDISGGALVEAMRGDINVRVKALTATKPLSFTAMRGEITLHVPDDAKANIHFRTHRGVILTNFDDKALVTKTEVARTPAKPVAPVAPEAPKASADVTVSHNGTDITVHADKNSDGESDWHADVRESVREAAAEAADAAREAAEAVREGLEEAHNQLGLVISPLPPMTGGKVVAGTLNGGGVEIQAATLSGDIRLKKND
jgi:hypothetical protein